ncbi:MAG: RluA family pseudouridine synthase [Gammaproteobacteria bacterium]|nr:RluA family pseudouridine synthase [Gammaproteobacteria bacterium]NNL99741.1 RluA family pseudouridine synthase [Gammaproteobacteria bacterium]
MLRIRSNLKDSPVPANRLSVGADEAGRRLDNFLLTRFKNVPRARIYRMVRSGEVRLNGGRVRPDRRVAAGDEVRVPPILVAEPGTTETALPASELARVEAAVVHEDEYCMVVNKPAGLAVHAGSGLSFGLIDVVRRLRPHAPHIELVHRLDRDTSGCVIIAKERRALTYMHEQLRERGFSKYYVALVAGHWPKQRRHIDLALSRRRGGAGESATVADTAGKAARTDIAGCRLLGDCSLMTLQLITGRTHQIRVHLASEGHPIAGDRRYGDAAFNREMRVHGLRRLFLHAERLEFTTHAGGPAVRVRAPLSAELAAVVEHLES